MDASEKSSAEYCEFEAEFKAYVAQNLRTDSATQQDKPCYVTLHSESAVSFAEKTAELHRLLKGAEHAVVYTGAGVSTSAGLPDYRGPDGVWTKAARGEQVDPSGFDVVAVAPTPTHKWIAEAVRRGAVKYVMTTNVDNLHVRSGLTRRIGPRSTRDAAAAAGEVTLSELHGNYCVVECAACDVLAFTDTPVPTYRPNPLDHTLPDDPCSDCGQPRRDVIVSFHSTFEDVPSMEQEHDYAWVNAIKADLFIVFGSSLSVPTACDLVDDAAAKGARIVFVNLQKTPKDHFAHLIIHAKCDDVVKELRRLDEAERADEM
eukprot:TRINITY_DN13577_c0_g1_i1.p2 TRINITY_DN13577_c0_g1~~TRINITY_DN13577_c0_g1_i1.p2  ORF type:complete len:342 (+),score=109.97 TRINITY_DN13577_c0_g1_i1:76-1026(+)